MCPTRGFLRHVFSLRFALVEVWQSRSGAVQGRSRCFAGQRASERSVVSFGTSWMVPEPSGRTVQRSEVPKQIFPLRPTELRR